MIKKSAFLTTKIEVAEKEHIEMFSVANFVLSKKLLVMKRFVLNIVL